MKTNGNSLTVIGTSSRRVSEVSDNESDQGLRKNIKFGNRKIAAWALFSEYSANSTLHGVKYLGERKIHWAERLFWVITFIISGYGCILLILEVSH